MTLDNPYKTTCGEPTNPNTSFNVACPENLRDSFLCFSASPACSSHIPFRPGCASPEPLLKNFSLIRILCGVNNRTPSFWELISNSLSPLWQRHPEPQALTHLNLLNSNPVTRCVCTCSKMAYIKRQAQLGWVRRRLGKLKCVGICPNCTFFRRSRG